MQADVFCRVIDNYGDIGVTWRLVCQLQREYGWEIRLWVDDLKSFKRLEPGVEPVAQQTINGVEIIDWNQASDFTPRPIVVATFSCDLPESFLNNLHASPSSLWINLEYLSAEDWVEGCHRLPSLRSDGLSAYFYFPGFTKNTGGLLREADLMTRRDLWQADRVAQRAFLEKLGLSQGAIAVLFPVQSGTSPSHTPTARLIHLFCYDNAPVRSLIQVLSDDPRPSVLLIPESIHPQYPSGQLGQLCIERIPFYPSLCMTNSSGPPILTLSEVRIRLFVGSGQASL